MREPEVNANKLAARPARGSIGLLLITFLDHPYRSGPGGIQPPAMTATLTMMRQQEPGLRFPCRGDGVPFPTDHDR